MRGISTTLFALMAVMLPMAGVQHYFCTMSMTFVSNGNECPVETKDCCGKTEKHKPVDPDCMVVAKLLPNAETPSPFQVPGATGIWSMLSVSMDALAPGERVGRISPEKDRGPPDRHRLFMEHQRLLI
jgi:hypothetical protein